MQTECSVVNCGYTSCETKVLYKFPVTFDTCMQWVQNTGNKKLMQDFSLGGLQILMEKRICSDHFSDQDFEVFGEPKSGIRCHTVPLKNLKKELQIKDKPKPSVKKKNKTIVRSTSDAIPVVQIKEESNEIDSAVSVTIEDGNTKCSSRDTVSFVNIKEEPDSDRKDNVIPFPLIHPDKNVVSSDPLTITPKIEQVDIEEVLLPEKFIDNDESMDAPTEGDQFHDLPEYIEEIKNSSRLIYATPQKGKVSRKTDLSKKSKHARKQASARERETFEQRAVRLEKVRVRASERRQSESEVETLLRRYKCAVRAAVKRSRENEEEKRIRREKNKIRAAKRRKNMTPEQRAEWRERNRIQTKERRERESELKKIVRRYNNAIRASMKRSSETPEQRMERRLKDALRAAERRKMETPEEREERLKKDRERITLRRLQLLMSESPEQREARLKRERERMYRKRHGITEDNTSTETSNDGIDSQQYSEESIQNLSEILIMYPPSVEIQVPEDAENVIS